jgi:hypothetical protein
MNIYEFAARESYEWVVPVSDTGFVVFREFDGKARGSGWRPIRKRLVTHDEQDRRLLPADMPWLGKPAPVLKKKASAALEAILARDGEITRFDIGVAVRRPS